MFSSEKKTWLRTNYSPEMRLCTFLPQ